MRTIFIFESLHKLIKADKLLQLKQIKVRVIPVPTSYHSTCGMCLECDEVSASSADDLLKQEGFWFERHHLT